MEQVISFGKGWLFPWLKGWIGKSHAVSLTIWETENRESHNFKLVMSVNQVQYEQISTEKFVCTEDSTILYRYINMNTINFLLAKKDKTGTKMAII